MTLKNSKQYWTNTDLLDIKGEIWKDVLGHEGFYVVSNMGRVKSLERVVQRIRGGVASKTNVIKIKERILKQNNLQTGGYCSVKLLKNRITTNEKVHRLVANAFLNNTENKRTVNHKNGIKTDNFVDNLEWATYSENIKHAFKTGLNKVKPEFLLKGAANPKSKWVNQYTLEGKLVRQFGSQQEAARETGVDQSMIFHCCKGKQKTAGGYKWSYAEGFGWGRKGAEKGKEGFIIKR